MAFWQWSKTASNNGNSDPTINWQEGMPPALINDSGRAVNARLAEYRDDTSGLLLTAGTSTAYTVTTNQGLPATPNDGQLIVVSFHVQNGTAPTLAADGGTAFPIHFTPGFGLSASVLDANTPTPLKFRAASSAWIMSQSGIAMQAMSVSPGSVSNAGFVNAPAWTIKGNPTGGSASPTDFTIPSLTAKPVPQNADVLILWDSTANQLKSCSAAQIGAAFVQPTVQRFTSGSGTYTPTTNTVRIKVRMVGGGGGGGAAATNNGANGTATSFGAWAANPGSGGLTGAGGNGAGGSGGANGTGTLVARFSGATGGPGWGSTGGNNMFGGYGGASLFGGGGAPGLSGPGGNAAANTGSGGAGGATGNTAASAGGGAGEYVEFWMTAAQVGASQTYTVGPGGAGGAAGTQPGGNGAAGILVIEEFYI